MPNDTGVMRRLRRARVAAIRYFFTGGEGDTGVPKRRTDDVSSYPAAVRIRPGFTRTRKPRRDDEPPSGDPKYMLRSEPPTASAQRHAGEGGREGWGGRRGEKKQGGKKKQAGGDRRCMEGSVPRAVQGGR
eukprot:352366-Chlamydomonas_euryale.AAC.4